MIKRSLCIVLLLVGLFLGVSENAWVMTKVTYWNMGANQDYVDHMVRKFNETHDQIELDATRMASGLQNLSQVIASHITNDVPDLIYMDRGVITQLKFSGLLLDLTPFIEAEGWDLDESWFSATLGTIRHRDRSYGIPRDALVMTALFRNTELFAQSGLDVDVAPGTIEELIEADRRLTRLEADGRASQVGFLPWDGLGRYGLIWSLLWGTDWWDPVNHVPTLNNARNVEMLEWIETWSNRTYSQLSGATWNGNAFLEGKLGMVMWGGEQLPRLMASGLDPSLVRVSPMPVTPGDQESRLYVAGEGWVIPARAQNPEAAWDVIKWLLEPENAAEFAMISGKPPARISGAQEFMTRLTDPIYKSLMEVTFTTETVAIAGTPLDIVAGWTPLQQALASVTSQQEGALAALDRAQAVAVGKVNEYLDANGPWW